MRPSQLALLSLLLGGCLRLQLREEEDPIAVGASFRPVATNWRLQCDGLDFTSCHLRHAHVYAVEAPERLFSVSGARLTALDEGSARVRVHARIGQKERSRRMTLETARADDIWISSLGAVVLDAFVAPPGATLVTSWAARDRDGRRLMGDSFQAWDDPSGTIDIRPAERGPAVEMRMPASTHDAIELIGDHGARVATVRVGTPEPELLELLFDPDWGDSAQAQLIGWSGDFAILYSEVPVRWASLTPEVCEAPPDSLLGVIVSSAILQAGTCTLQASADLPGAPFETTLSASAGVAPAIPRNAP
ncbi:MAG: hypothetical protein EA397_11630 [Deltaproteobacteria bacterium]|nr:MAG: hypothetical protein EA397_11630 [Deltaproteobacteria bacterium]